MITELRELARAATPGPWVADDTTFDDGPSTGWFREGPGRVDTGEYNTLSWADATFIAACDPATILRLCDVAELGEAWAEAEAALPAFIAQLAAEEPDADWNDQWSIGFGGDRGVFRAYVYALSEGSLNYYGHYAETEGDSLLAVLRALAAKLKEGT